MIFGSGFGDPEAESTKGTNGTNGTKEPANKLLEWKRIRD